MFPTLNHFLFLYKFGGLCVDFERKQVYPEEVEMATFLNEFKKYCMWAMFLQNPDNKMCHGVGETLMLPLFDQNISTL